MQTKTNIKIKFKSTLEQSAKIFKIKHLTKVMITKILIDRKSQGQVLQPFSSKII